MEIIPQSPDIIRVKLLLEPFIRPVARPCFGGALLWGMAGVPYPFTFSRGVTLVLHTPSLMERESTYGGFSAIRVCALQRRNSGMQTDMTDKKQ